MNDRNLLKSKAPIRAAGNLTMQVLDAIIAVPEVFDAARTHRSALLRDGLGGVRAVREWQRRRDVRQRVALLKSRGLVRTQRQGGRLTYALTDKGQAAHLRFEIRACQERRDGLLTVVIFDVPEAVRSSRICLQSFLKRAGFERLQLSVWTTKKDCAGLIARWLSRRGFGKWARVLIAKVV